MLAETIDLGSMTTDERLVLLGRLLDTLTPDDAFTPSPAWHKDVLEERVREEQRGHVLFATLEEARKNVSLGSSAPVEGVYWGLYHDYQELLGDNPQALMVCALDEKLRQFPVFAVVNACDPKLEKQIRTAVETYAETGKLSKSPKRLRWHLAIRMMLGASILYPYRRGQLPRDGHFNRLLNQMEPPDIVKMLLLEFVPIYCSVLSDYFMFDREFPHDPNAPLLAPVGA
jgi:hypothetical protein